MAGAELFLLSLDCGGVLYAPLKGSAAAVDVGARERLLRRGACALPPGLAELALRSEGRPSKVRGPFAPAFVGLVLTRACNLACAYCDFRDGPDAGRPMSLETGFAAVEAMAELAVKNRRERLEVHFLGGEPLLEFDLVRRVVERARAVAADRSLRTWFEISTNGIADDKAIRWIGANLNRVVLSLDGPPEVHDRFRRGRKGEGSGEGALTSARQLDESTAELVLRACISSRTVDGFAVNLEQVLQLVSPRVVSVEPVHARTGEQDIQPPTAEQFVTAFVAARAVCDERGVDLVFSGADLSRRAVSPCGVARDGFIVHPDGEVAACYLPPSAWRRRVLDLGFGEMKLGAVFKIDADRLQGVRNLEVESLDGCGDCLWRWHCGGGCRVRRQGQQNAGDEWCRMVSAIGTWQLLEACGLGDLETSFDAASWHRVGMETTTR